MKITKELLRKYAAGECSLQERLAIEQWLPSELDVEDIISNDIVEEETAQIWDVISKDIPEEKKQTTFISKYKKLVPYTIAASVAGLCFILSLFTNNGTSQEIADSGFLYVYSSQSKGLKVDADHCNINYSGTIIVSNTSKEVKSITCNSEGVKTFEIQPESIYYLLQKDGSPFLIKENDPTEMVGATRRSRGTYDLLCASI